MALVLSASYSRTPCSTEDNWAHTDGEIHHMMAKAGSFSTNISYRALQFILLTSKSHIINYVSMDSALKFVLKTQY